MDKASSLAALSLPADRSLVKFSQAGLNVSSRDVVAFAAAELRSAGKRQKEGNSITEKVQNDKFG